VVALRNIVQLARAVEAADEASRPRHPRLSSECSLAIQTAADGVRQCLSRLRRR